MVYGTSVHCMDGRIQEPLINFIKKRYDLRYIDTITEAGPCRVISENTDLTLIESINRRISISINIHKSKIIFISGHYDCAGNPVGKKIQIQQIKKCEEILSVKHPRIKIVKLWVNSNWKVEEL